MTEMIGDRGPSGRVPDRTPELVPAWRFSAHDSPAVTRTVRSKLEKRRSELAAQVADGFAQSWDDYRLRTGEIRGIDIAIQFCIEAERRLTD